MDKYKIEGLSFNGGDDKKENTKGKLKAPISFEFEGNLSDLSLDGLFKTEPVKIKKKDNSKKVIVADFKKSKKRKGNELI